MARAQSGTEEPALLGAVRGAADSDALFGVLGGIEDVRALSSREFTVAGRKLAELVTTPGFRIAYVGNHTMLPLPAYVGVHCGADGISTGSYVGEYNQYFQEVLAEDSALCRFDPQLIFCSLSMRDLAPRLHYDFASLDEAEREAEFEAVVSALVNWAAAAKQATQATLVVANFPAPSFSQLGLADLKQAESEVGFYLRLNLELLRVFRDDVRVYVLDMDRVASRVGKYHAFNPRMYYLAKAEWHEALVAELGEKLSRFVRAIVGRTKKCLVLDLDNTLWGGVVGEDGPDGVRVGIGDAESEAFLALQREVLGLKRRGVLLAINSKNNHDDVVEVFERRTDMPLRLDDFSATEINWNDKHENLVRIAETLNIGVDSLVFVDDNPVECALVREMLPAVHVVNLPRDPSEYASLLRRMSAFEKLSVTDDDRVKARQYADNKARDQQRGAAGNMADYLASLQTEITIRPPGARDAGRVHQLFNKTNQFNLTTKRYTPADVERFMNSADYALRIVEASDRFGNLGTIGVFLLDLKGDNPGIDSFLMSCRAMGREIESAIMNQIKQEVLLSGRLASLAAAFVPTKKNMPVADFFAGQGFALVDEAADGAKHYRLDAAQTSPKDCAHITVRVGDSVDE